MGPWLTHPFLHPQHGITTPKFKMVGSCSIRAVLFPDTDIPYD